MDSPRNFPEFLGECVRRTFSNFFVCLAILVCLLVSLFHGCVSTDTTVQVRQEKLQAEANRQAGLPNIINFTEKKMMKEIYELRDSQIRTWTYYLDMNGRRHLLCESLGYGIPYSTQYSNPMKESSSGRVIPQAEPNGLFMPASAEGTWIMAVTKDGPRPIYCEPRVIVSPFPLLEEKTP